MYIKWMYASIIKCITQTLPLLWSDRRAFQTFFFLNLLLGGAVGQNRGGGCMPLVPPPLDPRLIRRAFCLWRQQFVWYRPNQELSTRQESSWPNPSTHRTRDIPFSRFTCQVLRFTCPNPKAHSGSYFLYTLYCFNYIKSIAVSFL